VGPHAIDYAIEAYSLEKIYRTRNGRQPAVDKLDLKVPVGGVHGFLGPNGSGKTTTIRMLLGLIAADAGHIRIFDHEVPLAIDRVIDRVGAIVEQPKFFPHSLGRRTSGCWPGQFGRHNGGLRPCSKRWGWHAAAATSFASTPSA